MDTQQPIDILQALASGIDPISGEQLPVDAPYNRPDIIRALYASIEQLKHPPTVNNGSATASGKSKTLPKNSGKPWTAEMKEILRKGFAAGETPAQLAEKLARTKVSITCELEKQGLILPGEGGGRF